jgi:colicin import membrane protein
VHASLIISVVLHAALLLWALVTIHRAPDDRPPITEPVAVAIVTPDDVTRLTRGDRNAKQLEAEAKESPRPDPPMKEAPKPTPVAAAPPPPPPPEPEAKPPEPVKPEPPKPDPIAQKMAALAKEPPPEPVPAPGPTPDEQKRLEEKLEQERKAEEQRKREEAARKRAEDERQRKEEQKRKQDEAKRKAAEDAKKKQKEFNADKLADLLNKIPDKGGPPASAQKSDKATKVRAPVAGAPEGRDTRLTASEIGLLVRLIKTCIDGQYRRLNGSAEADRLVFDMRIRLNQDGTLVGPPQVMNAQSSPFFLAASENAIRAATSCQPYQLPADKYAFWKDVILEFGRN